MDLILVRHAIAAERDPRRWPDDRERPLTPAGIARARQAARGVRALLPKPQRVLTSPLVRAVQTAELLQRGCGWPAGTLCPGLEPGAGPQGLLELLRRAREDRIALIGHQPDLGRFIAHCIGGELGESALDLRKFGMAGVSFQSTLRAGRGRLDWLLRPRMLRALAR